MDIKQYWEWLVVILFFLIIIIRNKKRGFFWKARDGSELTIKQFFKRWGKGIEGITPLQQSKTQLFGTWIVISGIIAGIMINILTRIKNQWYWITIVLMGSLIISSISMVGIYQKYKIQKRVEQTMKELNEQPIQ